MMIKTIKIKVKDVDQEFINKLGKAFPSDDENPNWTLKSTQSFIADHKNLLLIGFVNNEMAGYIYGHFLDRFDDQTKFFIYALYTNPTHRKKGVMKAIFSKLFEILKLHGVKKAWVLTNKSNKPAMALYISQNGFIENGDDVMFEFNIP